jgi:uncharacterized protein YbjQ (UPF0145 family)
MPCSRCGARLGLLSAFTTNLAGDNLCAECERKRELSKVEQQKRDREIAKRVETVIVTTTPTLEGHRIVTYLGIESVEIVIGTGLFVELTGEIADFFGQRSKGFEGKLQNAKRVAFQAMKTLAVQQDANAVVGIDMDYTEFSGNRIGLIVNGTLVRTVPIQELSTERHQRKPSS